MRGGVAGRGEGTAGRLRVEAPGGGDAFARLGAVAGGFGGELQGKLAASPAFGQPGGPQPMGVPGPEQLARHHGPAQVEVGVVLPGEADTAEDLDAVLGAAVGGVQSRARGEGGDQCAGLRGLVRRAGGVPHQRAGLLDAYEHVGAEVFDALELSDGAAELLTDLGVRDGGVQRPGGGAACLGGEQDGREIADGPGVDAYGTGGGDEYAVDADLGGGSGRVGAAVRAYGHPFGSGVDGEPAGAATMRRGAGAGRHRRRRARAGRRRRGNGRPRSPQR